MTRMRRFLLATLLTCAGSVQAVEPKVVTIKGVVYAAIPCVINDNKPITAAFGDVLIAAIDGHYKTITMNYTLDCARSASRELQMQVRGNSAGFDPASLQVQGFDNLGIALTKDGTPLAINTWSDFDTDKQPLLQAVLVKSNAGEVKAGSFSAGATLMVDYR